MTFPIPEAALQHHTAVLGKTGSGKTTTAKTMVEHIVAFDKRARVCIPTAGRVALSENAPLDPLTVDEAKAKVYSVLSNPQRKLVEALLEAGEAITRDELGARTDYSPSSGGFNNLIGSLSTLTIFEKPAPGMVDLSAWAKEVLT